MHSRRPPSFPFFPRLSFRTLSLHLFSLTFTPSSNPPSPRLSSLTPSSFNPPSPCLSFNPPSLPPSLTPLASRQGVAVSAPSSVTGPLCPSSATAMCRATTTTPQPRRPRPHAHSLPLLHPPALLTPPQQGHHRPPPPINHMAASYPSRYEQSRKGVLTPHPLPAAPFAPFAPSPCPPPPPLRPTSRSRTNPIFP